MRLVEVKLENFRGYSTVTSIELDPLTILIGRNDAGKSSILDALDVFFNDASIESMDRCVHTQSDDVSIACVFDGPFEPVIIDETNATTLADEYLLRDDGKLEICKVYNCAPAKGKLTNVFVRASHPSAPNLDDLLSLKIADLKKRASQLNVNLTGTNQTVKAELRRTLWKGSADLKCISTEVALLKESGKEVWEELQKHLPLYALFKSDRASTDQDAEAQDPMKAAIKEVIQAREQELNGVLAAIKSELENVANRTVAKIREMSEELANELRPTVKYKNWDSLFSVALTGEDDIPLNKRGSGTRRLVLLNFFRAKAEEFSNANRSGVIYAVEEPETSQHPNHQMMLLEAFEDLVEQGSCQVLLTTHTPTLARRAHRNALRLVTRTSSNTSPAIMHGNVDQTLQAIKETLGVLPDHDIKAFFGVEGKHDINFLKSLSRILVAAGESDIPDLEVAEREGKLIFIPLAGSNMDLWVARLAKFERPEFYLTDRDNPPPAAPKYEKQIEEWRKRAGCAAWATSKRELENYLHPSVIATEAPGYTGTGTNDFDDVPLLFAEAVHSADPSASTWATITHDAREKKTSRAKKRLNTTCVDAMTPALLNQSDPNDEIRSWLRAIGQSLNT